MSLAPPATRDAWSYGGDFHVGVTGNNRHRRATIPELKAVFDGSDGSKDRPAHWYEAQLIHYGLPPSKTKGTAKMRLFDAVNNGNLAVPPHILKVESDLKKEWTKQEREAKQALKKLSAATPTKRPNKRKADDTQVAVGSGTNININLSLSVGPQGNVQVAPTMHTPKKARTTQSTPSEKPQKAKEPAKKPTTTPRASASKATSTPRPAPDKAPRTKQTARRGVPFPAPSGRGAKSTSSPSSKPTVRLVQTARQTARRSRPSGPSNQGRPAAANDQPHRFDATPSHWDSYNEPPPAYSSPENADDYGYSDSESKPRDDRLLPPLGLLNGRYNLRCTSASGYVDPGEDSGIIFTLDGNALWGSFEIGPLSGILRLDERPWQSSYDPLFFQWRAEDGNGEYHAETDDGSYVKFLGDGEIVGRIGFYDEMLEFDGCRVSGQQTRSEVSAAAMRRQWDERRL
jgi:hypothetical protein